MSKLFVVPDPTHRPTLRPLSAPRPPRLATWQAALVTAGRLIVNWWYRIWVIFLGIDTLVRLLESYADRYASNELWLKPSRKGYIIVVRKR